MTSSSSDTGNSSKKVEGDFSSSKSTDEIPSKSSEKSGLLQIIINFIQLVGGKAIGGLISIVYLLIVTRYLGATGYGVLTLLYGYSLLIGNLVAFSGFHGVVRYGAIALENKRYSFFARLVRCMAVIEGSCGIIAVIIAAILAPIIGPHLGWPPNIMTEAEIFSLAVLATVRQTPQGILQLAHRFDLIGLHQVTMPLFRLIGTLIAWLTRGGLDSFIMVWMISAVIECLAMWALAAHEWPKLSHNQPFFGAWRSVPKEQPGLIHFAIMTNFDLTLRELTPNLVPLTIGWCLGTSATGLFSLAQKASNILQQPALLLLQASYSVLAKIAARKNYRMLQHTVWRGSGLSVIVSVIFLTLIALFGRQLMVSVGGKTFDSGSLLVLLVATARAISLIATPILSGLTTISRPHHPVLITIFINIGLYPLLPWMLIHFGLYGAGIHACILESCGLFLFAILFYKTSEKLKMT
ncbi:MAG: lipopolysaccharide biosynthesis protein [Zymomonas mobilis subsp. pomaceae]|uniref:Polysaccharide biosynthesis protein n=1 Tax=Zymomonas mobilis subsp. pomaceae (strain ATCC 29192 / DSM 22645 / JCM 10191 / CCUG 17912 / NBRC 13757 / NCIMB 11200 / NRRL B-4491 / Barker I) TaxID=579138 RepID=F8EV56_ZYMMT|nr:lipopolysaccharide biosynthesis protein [Zymomonas mobilis]AEI38274.1 polysaccharide biosynthesis protein [Zymomonas mobilis subsp. pomaceae ATCC 29192]MDX5947963.1 lipopolysaccharide biosynthesis protein [Zymomonas mobilis subsp. pomaceae]GEB89292.1 hypothetical protein ZMO02_09290 [Zymomonas mobilis subsp. pomaceae]